MHCYRVTVLLLVILVGTLMAESVPSDFLLRAHFAPRGDSPDPWDLTIHADGHGRRVVYKDTKDIQTNVRLPRSAVRKLVETIRNENFFTLPDFATLQERIPHSPALFLSIEMDGRKHEVQLICWGDSDRAMRSRLHQIWKVLLRELRSPNGNTELECFD